MCREVYEAVLSSDWWWWRTERSLLFLPHPGIGPSQSAEGVWPGERVWLEGGSDAKGRGFLVSFAERGVLVERKEKLREKDFSLDERRVLEACSESLRSKK